MSAAALQPGIEIPDPTPPPGQRPPPTLPPGGGLPGETPPEPEDWPEIEEDRPSIDEPSRRAPDHLPGGPANPHPRQLRHTRLDR